MSYFYNLDYLLEMGTNEYFESPAANNDFGERILCLLIGVKLRKFTQEQAK